MIKRLHAVLCTYYRWPLCGYTVRYGSANQANSAFHPPGVSK